MDTNNSTNNKLYTVGEEVFNSVSHGVGSLLSIAGLILMIVRSVHHADRLSLICSIIFGLSLIILYTMSTLYHAITNVRAKSVLRILDHSSIYLLIAGTYTPLTLSLLRGEFKATLIFAIVWFGALLGIILNTISLTRFKKFSLVLYVLMGWAVVFNIPSVYRALPTMGFVFLFVGGLFYTVGIIFYVWHKHYFHSIWHLFVLAGSIFHFFTVYLYAI